jgi:hypothetical protein
MTSTGRHLWVLARNAGGRVRAQHAVDGSSDGRTVCGWPVYGWSREYADGPLPIIACKTCLAHTGANANRRRLSLVS